MARTQQVKVNLLFGADTTAAMNNITRLGQLLNQISTKSTIGVNSGSLVEAVQAAQQLQIHLQNALNQNTGRLDLSKLNASLKSADTNLATLATKLRGVGTDGQQAFNRLAMAVSSAEVPMFNLGKRMNKFMETLGNTLRWQLASNLINGVSGALSGAVSHAEELNEALNNIRIVTGLNTQAMADFTQEAARAAKILSTTATEYAQAALIFYQQGLSGDDVIERTNVVIKLANVTGEAVDTVSSQMTAIWNNFYDGSKSLEYYADALTKLGAATAASTDDISEGLSKFAAIADTVGLSYEYAAAAIATVVDKTQQSSEEVGTAFKTLFGRIEGLSLGETLDDGVTLNKYSEALNKVGVNILDSNNQLKEMDDILDEVGERWDIIGRESQVALAQTVGGMRQYAQFIALMDNWGSVKDNIELAANAQGELTTQQNIWADSIEAAENRYQAAKDEMSEDLISEDVLIAFNNAMADVVSTIDNVVDSFGGIGVVVLSLVGIFSKTLFPLLQVGFTKLRSNINVLTGAANKEIAAMQTEMSTQIQEMATMPGITEAMREQLMLSDQLITAKQEMARVSKTLSIAKQEEYERRMNLISAMATEAQKALEAKQAAEEEVKTAKNNVVKGESGKQLRVAAGTAHVRNTVDHDPDKFSEQNWEQTQQIAAGYLNSPSALQKQFDQSNQNAINASKEVTKARDKLADLSSRTPKNIEQEKMFKQQIADQERLVELAEQKHRQAEAEHEQNRLALEIIKESIKLKVEDASVGTIGIDVDEQEMQANLLGAMQQKGVSGAAIEGEQVKADASIANLEKLNQIRSQYNTTNQKATNILDTLNSAEKEAAKLTELGAKRTVEQVQAQEQVIAKYKQQKAAVKTLAEEYGKTDAEVKELTQLFDELSTENYDATIKQIDAALEEMGNGAANAGGYIEILTEDTLQKLMNSVSDAEGLERLEQAFEQLGVSSEEAAQKLAAVQARLEENQVPVASGADKFIGFATSIASAAGQVSMFTSGIQSMFMAFEEGTSSLESVSTLMSGIAMTLPVIIGLYKLMTHVTYDKVVADTLETAAKARKAKLSITERANLIAETKATQKNTTAKWYNVAAEWARQAIANPIVAGLLVTAIVAGTAAILANTNATEKETEALKANASARREAADAAKEQADSNKDLVESFNDLYNAYKETGEITEELTAKSYELIDAYNLEGGAIAVLSNNYDQLAESIAAARKEELARVASDEKRAADAARIVATNAITEGHGYVTTRNGKSVIQFDADQLGSSAALSKIRGKYNNQQSGAYFDKAGNLILDTSSNEAMAQGIATLKEIQNSIIKYYEENGGNSAVDSAYLKIQTQLDDAQESIDQLTTAVDNKINADIEKILLDQSELLNVESYADYTKLRTNYETAIKNLLLNKGYAEGTESYDNYLDYALKALSAYSSEFATYNQAQKSFEDLREGAEALGRETDNLKDLEEYYNRLSPEEQTIFWTVGVNAASTVESMSEAIKQAQIFADNNELQLSISFADSLHELLDSDNKEWDKIKEAFEKANLGISWLEFLGLDEDEQTELILEKKLSNIQQILNTYSKKLETIENWTYDTQLVPQIAQAENDLAKAIEDQQTAEKNLELANRQAEDKVLLQGIETRYNMEQGWDEYVHHGVMGNLFDEILDAYEFTNEEEAKAYNLFRDLNYKLHNRTYNESNELTEEEYELLRGVLGGDAIVDEGTYSNDSIDDISATSVIDSFINYAQNRAKYGYTSGLASQDLDENTLEGWVNYVVDQLPSVDEEFWNEFKAEADKRYNAANQIIQTTDIEAEFNKRRGEAMAELRQQQITALDSLRQVADGLGINVEEYEAYVLAVEAAGDVNETLNETLQKQLYLNRLGAMASLSHAEGLNSIIENGAEWLEVLRNENATLSEQASILPELQKAMTKLLGIEEADFAKLWGKGFFNISNNQNLLGKILQGDEQALYDFKLVAATSLAGGDASSASLLKGIQYNNLQEGNVYKVGEKGASADELGMFNRIQNAMLQGLDKESIEALGFVLEIDKASGALLGYTKTAQGFNAENIQMLEDLRKQAQEAITPYKEITDQINLLNDALNETQGLAERLYGASQIAMMRHEQKILIWTNDALDQRIAEAQEYQRHYQTQLEELGIGFNKDGTINNYTLEQVAALTEGNYTRQAEINELVEKYDSAREQQIQDEQAQIENRYEILDLDKEILDITLETNQAIEDRNLEDIEYELSKIEDDFYKIAEAGALMSAINNESQYNSYINQLNNELSYLKQLKDLKDNPEQQANYVEGLLSARDGIMENLENLQELKIEMKEYYGNVLDMATEKIGRYTDLMSNQASELEHYANIMELVGKSNDFNRLSIILKGQADTAKQQLDIARTNAAMLKEEAENAKIQYEQALTGDDESLKEYWEEQWLVAQEAADEAREEELTKTEEWLEQEKAVIENGFAKIAQVLENALTGGTSFDALTTSLERAASIQEEYLTTTNKIYETTKLMQNAQKAIDKSTSTVAKQKLKQFVNETQQLQNQTQLSQYELTIQQAKYDLLLAEIALEDAQNATQTVRLQRDAEGNFGYVYTANQNAVDSALEEVQAKENALYNIGLEGANDYTEKYTQTMTEWGQGLIELNQNRLDNMYESEEEYQAEVDKLNQYYQEKIEQYSYLRGTALATDARIAQDAWSTSYATSLPKIEEITSAVGEYLIQSTELFSDWEALGTAAQTVFGNSMDDTKLKIENVTSAVGELADKLGGENGVLKKVSDTLDKVTPLVTAMGTLTTSINTTMSTYEGYLTSINSELKTLAETDAKVPKPEITFQMSTAERDALVGAIGDKLASITIQTVDVSDKIRQLTSKEQDFWRSYISWAESVGKEQNLLSANELDNLDELKNAVNKGQGEKKLFDNYSASKMINSFEILIASVLNKNPTMSTHLGAELYDLLESQKYSELLNRLQYYQAFDTGGYTGAWGPEGKLALLHQKEIVLNAQDTANLLAGVEVVRDIVKMIDMQSMSAQLGGLLSSPSFTSNNIGGTLEQAVTIEASFPGVTDRYEIEEAFTNLVNKASQYANRK